jgi:hypothetical protein
MVAYKHFRGLLYISIFFQKKVPNIKVSDQMVILNSQICRAFYFIVLDL